MSASISFWIFCVEINNAYSDEKIGFNQAADKESDQEFDHLADCWIHQLYEIQAADQAVGQEIDQAADCKLIRCAEYLNSTAKNFIRDWWQEYNKKNSKKSTMIYTSRFWNNLIFQFHSVFTWCFKPDAILKTVCYILYVQSVWYSYKLA